MLLFQNERCPELAPLVVALVMPWVGPSMLIPKSCSWTLTTFVRLIAEAMLVMVLSMVARAPWPRSRMPISTSTSSVPSMLSGAVRL